MGNEQEANQQPSVPPAGAPPAYGAPPASAPIIQVQSGQVNVDIPATSNEIPHESGYHLLKGDFKHGLCSCFSSFPACLITLCCPFITYGRLANRLLDDKNSARTKFFVVFVIWLVFDCLYSSHLAALASGQFTVSGYFVLVCELVVAFLVYELLQKAKQEKNLPESCVKDVCKIYCCAPCVLCQLSNETGISDDVCSCGQINKLTGTELIKRV